MITPQEAAEFVVKENPNRNAASVFEYDDKFYMVSAPLKNVKVDYNGSLFRVNKTTGTVRVLVPMADRDKFAKALRNKLVDFKR